MALVAKQKSKITPELFDFFWLLSNEQRMRIGELLATNETQTTDELAAGAGINLSSVGVALVHFRTLKVLKLVRKEGRRAFYGIDKDRLRSLMFEFADTFDIDLSQGGRSKKKSAKKKAAKKKTTKKKAKKKR